MRNPISTSAEPHVTPFPHAVARFEDQFCIGTVYALSYGFTSLHSEKLKLSILIGS